MENNIITSFALEIPKIAKSLVKFVCKDDLRPILKYICIEPTRGLISATDTHKLRFINFESIAECPEGLQIFIDPKHIAKVAGKRVNITVSECERETEETVTNYGYFGRPQTKTVKRIFRTVEIEYKNESFITETDGGKFPNVLCVIPEKDNQKNIHLTPESIDALRTICKLHKNDIGIVFGMSENSNILTVCPKIDDYGENRAVYYLELAEPCELTTEIGFNPRYLSACLEGSNGIISIIDEYRAATFEGEADVTLLMPVMVDEATAKYIRNMRKNGTFSGNNFAYDSLMVFEHLKEAATDLWQDIKKYNAENSKYGKELTPGNYTAKDIANKDKSKCGKYTFPDYADYAFVLDVYFGNIRIKISYEKLFDIIATWESATNFQKTIFSVGNVEEVTGTVLYADSDKELAEKKIKLRVLGNGWYSPAKRNRSDSVTSIYYEIRGCIIYAGEIGIYIIDDALEFAKWSEGKAEQVPEIIRMRKAENKYFADLNERLGLTA